MMIYREDTIFFAVNNSYADKLVRQMEHNIFCSIISLVVGAVGCANARPKTDKTVYPNLKVGGHFQWYQPMGGGSLGVNQEGFFRRARLFVNGKVTPQWSYLMQYDFARRGQLRNFWFRYHKKSQFMQIGQFKVPFNSIYNQNSMFNWFNEWALPARAFAPGFVRAISYHYMPHMFNLQFSFFAPGTAKQAHINKPWGTTQRFLIVPYQQGNNFLQIGFSNWYQQTNNNVAAYADIPEAMGYIPVRTVKTGKIEGASYYDDIEAELLFQRNRFALESGFIYNFTPRQNQSTLNFYGLYGQISYMLNDASLKYNYMNGVFGKPTNMHHSYQWVLRVSNLNLNDQTIRGGDETNFATGINVYFLEHFKIGFNYIHAIVGGSQTTINGNANIVLTNLQLIFSE